MSVWRPFVLNYNPNADNIFYNLYERDWDHKKKCIGSGWRYGITVKLYGRMKYADEYYGQYPGQDPENIAELNIAYLYLAYTQWTVREWGHGGSYFQLWKVID